MPTLRKPGRPVDLELQAKRREEILDAAAVLFAECGFADADTQLLADRVGVAKGTIFRYFPTKRDLFFAAIDRGMARLRDWVHARADAVEEPLEKLHQAVHAYLEFFHEHPETADLLILERAQFKDRKSSYFVSRDRNDDGRWSELFAALIAAGRVRDLPIDQIRNVLGDLVYGTMFTNHLSGRRRGFEDQARDLIDVVFHGLLTDAERRRAPQPFRNAKVKSAAAKRGSKQR